MSIPTVAIIGRPNVGKSTLFNRIIGKRLAVVEDIPGVTRDRNYAVAEYDDRSFNLVDTGGFEPVSQDDVFSQMREQTNLAIEEADVIIFVTDVKEGLNASDLRVAEVLRKSGKPVIYCVNKVDGPKFEDSAYEFYRLGAGQLFTISALHGPGYGEMMDTLMEMLPGAEAGQEEDEVFANVAIIGRPNVGKSSLLNALTGEKRAVTHNAPGTTTDPVDTLVKYYGKTYNIVDTAGIRSRGKIASGVEKYSVIRALKAIDRCDVALVLIDSAEGLTEQDKKIVGIAHEEGKGVIIVLNKWDLVEKD
ncbi:MAG TPA: ribosome biogenesis GTPase Der, partial [Nitrospirota bacterium]